MLEKDHPFFYIQSLAKEQGFVFHFSRYKYTPDSILDERVMFELGTSFFNTSSINNLIEDLEKDEELALHSNFYIPRKNSERIDKYHIPMIDFSTSEWSYDLTNRLKHCLPEDIFKELLIFKSGRSFHGYALTKKSHPEWLDLMGRLLLINPPGQIYVDTRWVGHRIMAGYASLRWSAKTEQYKDLPRFVGHVQQM